jgi:hypothetical protein
MDLEKVLEKYKFDVPIQRKRINLGNLSWLEKNLGVRNMENPKYEVIMAEIKRRLKEKDYSN